jgi:cell division protein FtsB
LRELEHKVDHLTVENRKATEQVRKLKAERETPLKQVKNITLTVQKLNDMVNIPGIVWWKTKMFDAELKNAGHVSGSKMVTFIIDQGGKCRRKKFEWRKKALMLLLVKGCIGK